MTADALARESANTLRERFMIPATIVSKRLHPRAKVFQPAEIQRQAVVARGHVINLSAGGALVHSPALLPTDRQILLRFAGLDRACVIVWRVDDRAGVRFIDRLTDEQLQRAVAYRSRSRTG